MILLNQHLYGTCSQHRTSAGWEILTENLNIKKQTNKRQIYCIFNTVSKPCKFADVGQITRLKRSILNKFNESPNYFPKIIIALLLYICDSLKQL